MNQTFSEEPGWWEAVFLQVVDAILLVDDAGRIRAVNPAGCVLLGYRREELLEMFVGEIIPSGHREDVSEFAKSLSGQGKGRGADRVQRQDGTTLEVDYRAVANIRPGIHLAILRDRSDQRRIEGALQQSEVKFAAFMDHLPAYAWMKGVDGRYLFINKLCQATCLTSHPDYRGCTDDELWPLMAAEYKRNDQLVLQSRHAIQAIETFRLGDEVHSVLASKFPILDESGQPVMVGGVGLDITEWKRAEEKQQQLFRELQAANKQLSHLARQVLAAQEDERQRISRELHDEAAQALTAIKIILQSIEDDLPPDLARPLEQLRHVIGLTDATMDGIWRLARDLRPASLDVLPLNQSLEGLCHEFGRRTGLPIDYNGVELPPQPPEVRVCLYRVLQEALTNVSKHAAATQVRVELQSEAGGLRLTVADNGMGFAPQADGVPPTTGGGLGLIGIKERLELLRGRLLVESSHGTTLTAWVPATPVV